MEFLEKLFEKTTNFYGCLEVAIDRRDIPLEFIEKLFEKTKNFEGCLELAINKGLTLGFLEKLFEKTVCFVGCLLEAIDQGLPLEFLDRLLAKGGRVSSKSRTVPPGYEKYFHIFVENRECFICLLDFEEEQQEKCSLPCGHFVHTACNLQSFKCPYH